MDDPDFNKDGSAEGTGSDYITYKFPKPTGNLTATVELCFQTAKPQSIDSLRTVNEPDINHFVEMYDALPNIPFIMKSKTVNIVTDVSDDRNNQPDQHILYQNYPNPFNPSTKIKYSIKILPKSSLLIKGRLKEGFVTIKVYDILGKEVATLVDEYKPAGNYEVEFNGENLPSGVYYYQLKDGDFNETKKMLLLK